MKQGGMQNIKRFILIFLAFTVYAASGQEAFNDGPYIFYTSTSTIVKTIKQGELLTDSFSLTKQSTPSFPVRITAAEKPVFFIHLKKQLDNEPSEYSMPPKILALSDIEGTFNGFSKMLQTAGVIDQQLNWCFGNNHLVVTGDIVDRGDEVAACLWLLYKLEEEAKAAKGYVHVILGNHEIMNLSEDVRYVHPKYAKTASLMKTNYVELFYPNTEIGQWLRTKNIIEKIGDWLFVHGGISQQVNETGMSIKRVNNKVRPLYDKDGIDSVLVKEKATLFFSDNSPFWYRGYFLAPLATSEQVDSTLRQYKVEHIVVGHTIVDSVSTKYNRRVIAVDVNHHSGNYQALLIEGNKYYRLWANGRKDSLN
jgi:hypothetical protein